MGIAQTPIPPEELDVFKRLPPLEIVVDVGARTDTDYFALHPEAEYHLFEPNTEFFEELHAAVAGRPQTFLNNYGLGDVVGDFTYNDGRQGFVGGEAPIENGERVFPVDTLDNYVRRMGLTHIDFLKVDVEGYDFKVLLGAKDTLPRVRFLQYEYWDDQEEFHELLGESFDLENIGYRNVLCMNKKLVPQSFRKEMSAYLAKMGYKNLV